MKVWDNFERVSKEVEEINKRKELIEIIFKLSEEAINYDKQFSYNLMINKSIDELQLAVEDLKMDIRMHEAARVITRCFHRFQRRQAIKLKIRQRHEAALKI